MRQRLISGKFSEGKMQLLEVFIEKNRMTKDEIVDALCCKKSRKYKEKPKPLATIRKQVCSQLTRKTEKNWLDWAMEWGLIVKEAEELYSITEKGQALFFILLNKKQVSELYTPIEIRNPIVREKVTLLIKGHKDFREYFKRDYL
ncbi:MAG: hypothetical protein FWG55_01540 [Candidatus Bathyarchaeota archaeon]|nr:hypothetical protein [Candidatus Termiticorpusculum sp.]